MRDRSSERGNTILIATVMVLGLTVMALGLAKFVRSYAATSADRKGAGYPALQALYVAEMGINDLLYQSNAPNPALVAPPANLTGPAPAPYRPATNYGPFTITPTLTYTVTRQPGGTPNLHYLYRSVGTVTPEAEWSTWPAISRTLSFEVRLIGGYWVLEKYAHVSP